MEIFKTKAAVYNYVLNQKALGKTIGLVPTMGALHAGHLSLIKKSKLLNNITIATIFVNPTQFNNASDLQKYPQPLILDTKLLKNAGCNVLFLPATTEMYNATETWEYNLGTVANSLEGEHRPGHFKGVTQIVYKLFKAIPATTAFFGQKDFQQFLVIQQLVTQFNIPIKLQCCPIVRQNNGLALSSRNIQLSGDEKIKALVLYKTLIFIKENFKTIPIPQLISITKANFDNINGLKLVYLVICDKNTLQTIQDNDAPNALALIAVYVGNTRLIDNMMLD